jgi:hypothetical protein
LRDVVALHDVLAAEGTVSVDPAASATVDTIAASLAHIEVRALHARQ